MTFANPAGLLLLVLAVPVLLLHVLRPRRPRAAVPSTFLWDEAGAPTTAASPWQRLRWSVPLVLQLLAVVVLAGAAAQPARTEEVRLARHSVFVVDASGSMLARDGDPDRVSDARRRAASLRAKLPAGGVASLIEAGPRPRVLLTASPDRTAFDAALDRVEATASRPDLAGAFELAVSLETPGAPLGVVFVSDGALTTEEQALLPAGTTYAKVGERGANRAVTSLVVEPRGSGLHAAATIRNAAGPGVQQRLRIDVDGRTATTLDLDLPAGATVTREVDIPAGDRVEAMLVEGDDLLAADDRAVAVGARRPPLKVLLAGPDDPEDPFVESLLDAIPGVTVERRAEAVPATGHDLAIYQGVDPPPAPGAPFWAIAPPGGVPGVNVTGVVDKPAITLVRSDLPLLQGLDLARVFVHTAQRLEAAPAVEVLVAAEGTPLLLRGEVASTPFAYLGFPLKASTLQVQPVFPVLADRLLTDLVGGSLKLGALRVGQPLPVPPGVAVRVDGPRGSRQLAPGDPVPVADRPGAWTITPAGGTGRLVAVNAEPAEADPTPRDQLPIPTRPGAAEGGAKGQRSLVPWIVALAAVLLAVELVVARRQGGVARGRWRAALGVRAVIVGALVAAALGATLPGRGGGVATMLVVDGSGSLGPRGRADALDFARRALAAQPRSAQAGVVIFGGDARLELTVGPAGRFTNQTVTVDRHRTDLAGALQLAGAVLPAERKRRIVVVSDGRATDGDASAEAARLGAAGIEIDTRVVAGAAGLGAAVSGVDAPRRTRTGELVTVDVNVTATNAGPAEVVLRRDGAEVDTLLVDLDPGETELQLTDTAPAAGVARYEVEVRSRTTDTVSEDNTGYAAIEIEGPARVLIAEGRPGASTGVPAALRAGGIGVDVVDAADLPGAAKLSGYDSIVLVNVSAAQLGRERVADLDAVVKDLGRGLVVLGGDQAYGLGGYLGSDLEALLPVTSEVLDPKRRASVAEVLAIDSSGSMTACHCRGDSATAGRFTEGGVVKVDIAKAGAEQAIQALQANDQVGIIAFGAQARQVLEVQPRPDPGTVRESLTRVVPDGHTDILAGLRAAADQLRATKAQLRHIILFTDGFTAGGELDKVRDLAAELHREGITVSVLATGETAAGPELEAVAQAGHGRFYPGRDLSEIPRILAQEAVLASRSLVVEYEEGDVPTVVGTLAPVIGLQATPPLTGHLATTARAQAEVGLRIGQEQDPLLATWQAGLGRVTSWTSDAGAKWAAAWNEWQGAVAFWTAVVKDTFGADNAAVDVAATVDGERLKIDVEAPAGLPPGATATAHVAGPSNQRVDVPLERTEKGFTGQAPATAPGTYLVGIEVGGGTASAIATQSYAPEYRPGEPDTALLARLAATTGGRVDVAPDRVFDAEGLRAGRVRHPLAGVLLVIAALAWPCEIAIRRLSRRRALVPAAAPSGKTPSTRSAPIPKPDRAAAPPPPPPPPSPEPAAEAEPEPDTTLATLLRSTRKKRTGDE